MQITIKGKQMEVSARMRGHMERKLLRLARMVADEARIDVTVCEEQTRSAQDRFSVHLALSNLPHTIRDTIHGAASGISVATALDQALDKVTSQISRHKDRHTTAHRLPVSPVKVLALSSAGELAEIEEQKEQARTEQKLDAEENTVIWSRIMEIRRIEASPLSEPEVISQMEREGLAFYPFFNAETQSVNVMYRLTDGQGYGLLIPA